jgi:hypothetical protein
MIGGLPPEAVDQYGLSPVFFRDSLSFLVNFVGVCSRVGDPKESITVIATARGQVANFGRFC